MRNQPPIYSILLLSGLTLSFVLQHSEHAVAQSKSSVAPLMKLLKSGRVPAQRQGTLIELICRKGNKEDLGYIWGQITTNAFKGDLKEKSLLALKEAFQNRKIIPAGSLQGISTLINEKPPINLVAVELAGLWKVTSATEKLQQLALATKTNEKLRTAAIDALVSIGGPESMQAMNELTGENSPQEIRYLGAAALVTLNLKQAIKAGIKIMSSGQSGDPTPFIAAILEKQGAADQLAAAINSQKIPEDIAKKLLRYMYSVGRSDKLLSDALSKAAGMSGKEKKLTDAEFKQLVADVIDHGNAERGEKIFRRSDLSCMKCHAVSKAGGEVGPDLSPIGASSPVDYLVRSILYPNQAVKEAYQTYVIVTFEGKIIRGIIVDRNEERIILKDANGKQIVIPVDDIDDEAEGGSLMPQGLTKFLTRDELVDIVKYLSVLGKPGPYAIRSKPTVQRWLLMRNIPDLILSNETVDEELFEEHVLRAPSTDWTPQYAMVAGLLPYEELKTLTTDSSVLLQAEINVTEAGKIGFRVNSAQDTKIWIDARQLKSESENQFDLEKGIHKLTLLINLANRNEEGIQAEFFKPAGSKVSFTVVGGK
ncbi:HEAT repeat domain-containing protein [Gimesia aquarii]|uniref:Cytochrome c n=1 Tax=Gimesia aquarii TaxID=2527964 RepID=A0A517WZA2_9PLAN|nr:HEAT repeat domain-containing protein [Gimesia aquarii]QDU10579.1 Cytochrome c [Gimesia aquarii]